MAKKNEPHGIGDILNALASESPLGRNLEEARIWERWPDIAGMELVMHGRPLGIRDGRLVIEVDSAVWMHKFSYAKAKLIRKINTEIGRQMVSEIYLALSDELDALRAQDDEPEDPKLR